MARYRDAEDFNMPDSEIDRGFLKGHAWAFSLDPLHRVCEDYTK